MVGKPGEKSPLRRAEAHRDQQILGSEDLSGLGGFRTMKRAPKMLKNALVIVNLAA